MERELKKHIAENLRKYRVLRGYTQEYIADYLGKKDYTAYSRYEQGRSNLKMDDAIKLSALYEVEVQDLIKGAPSINNSPESTPNVEKNLSVLITLDGTPETLENQLKRLKKMNAMIEKGEI